MAYQAVVPQGKREADKRCPIKWALFFYNGNSKYTTKYTTKTNGGSNGY